MKITVIITVYNRPEMLMAALQALGQNTRPIDEVIVSDDGSHAAAAAQMQQFFAQCPFPVHYVRQDDLGCRLAAARNNAIRAATGDYIISIDCDILLMPDAVMAHERLARRGWFLAGNRALLDEDLTKQALAQELHPRLLNILWENSDRRHLQRALRQFQRNTWLRRFGLAKRHKPKILGCHFSLFREDIERVNGFDEEFVGWGHEDDDFALRLHMAGIRAGTVIMQARALHLQHPSAAPAKTGGTPSANDLYFHRRKVEYFCRRGLRQS